jgi:hypothetical protein
MSTLRRRGLGVQYIMDREGNIAVAGGPGASHMRSGWGPLGKGLSNRNVVGMEVIANDDSDVTPAQVESAKKFIAKYYPNTLLRGHGQVNPGHKQASEGMTIINAINKEREERDRSAIDRSNAGSKSVNGGKMNVDVNVKAPKGSKSDAEGDGVFEKVRINKTPQMGTGSEHSGSDSNQYNEE